MKFRLFGSFGVGLMSLAVAACLLAPAMAQDEQGGRRGGRGQGGPFGGRGGGPGGFGGGRGFQSGPALELMGLLRMEEVRKDIELDDEVWEVVQEKTQVDFRAMRDMSEDERAKKMEEMNSVAQDLMDEALEPSQQERLMGLLAQQAGPRAALNDIVAEKIGLKDASKKKLQEALEKQGEEMREKMQSVFAEMGFGRGGGRGPGGAGGEGGRPDFTQMREKMEEMRKESTEALEAEFKKVDAGAFKKFEDLKGEKFEFPQFGGFGGRGGGPGGFGGGRGGRGGGEAGGRGGRPGGGGRDSGDDN